MLADSLWIIYIIVCIFHVTSHMYEQLQLFQVVRIYGNNVQGRFKSKGPVTEFWSIC